MDGGAERVKVLTLSYISYCAFKHRTRRDDVYEDMVVLYILTTVFPTTSSLAFDFVQLSAAGTVTTVLAQPYPRGSRFVSY
jgi:hypothetical protein